MLSLVRCDDTCGFLAAIFGAICYGTYGVPIKATSSIGAHPLVVQSYKTLVAFTVSLVVLFAEEQPRWTSYGLLSGLLWVSGGILGILAIRNAGIATAVGTWSSIMVIMNFVWGILVFHEPVHSLSATCGAFIFLGMGLLGMTTFSSPGRSGRTYDEIAVMDAKELEPAIENEGAYADDRGLTSRSKRGACDAEESDTINPATPKISTSGYNSDNYVAEKDAGSKIFISKQICGRQFTQWQAGVIYAGLTGCLTGSSLVPLHYAQLDGFTHLSYYISLASGALIANIFLWVLFFLSKYIDPNEDRTILKTYESMPKWHVKQLWFRLIIAGLLSNGGMFGSILATSSLGQAIGNSLIQLKILISGLWGICYYQEAKDRQSAINWFLSATICVASILCLTYQRRKISRDIEE